MPQESAVARPRAARMPAEERRKQILDAAVDVFARQGYAGTGTADIARAAGIGEPTIYRYFANKRELYVAAIREGAESIFDHWAAVAEAADPLAALSEIGVWYYEQMKRRPEVLQLRSRSASEAPDAEAREIVREEYRRVLALVQSLFERARERGQLAATADTRTLAWLFMSVGALLDQAQLIGLQDELTDNDVVRLAQLLQAQAST